MKKTLLTIIAALLLGGVVNAQGWGETDSHAKSSNTPIVASITLDGEAVTPTADYRLGAFVGEELRGLAAPHDNNFWIQVFYDQGTNETITFKFYDGSQEYTTCSVTKATQEEGWVTPGEPVVLDFTSMQTQTTALVAGWNWFAPTVEISLDNLEMSLGENGVIIRAQDGKFAMYDEDDEEWSGNLLSLIPGQMYMIQVVSSCSPSLTGRPISNITHTIVLGNNWFGYTNRQTMLVEDAFDDFSPVEGDRIKSADGKFAIYEDDEWSGNLLNLVPGQGYIYVSQDEETKNLIIPAN